MASHRETGFRMAEIEGCFIHKESMLLTRIFFFFFFFFFFFLAWLSLALLSCGDLGHRDVAARAHVVDLARGPLLDHEPGRRATVDARR